MAKPQGYVAPQAELHLAEDEAAVLLLGLSRVTTTTTAAASIVPLSANSLLVQTCPRCLDHIGSLHLLPASSSASDSGRFFAAVVVVVVDIPAVDAAGRGLQKEPFACVRLRRG